MKLEYTNLNAILDSENFKIQKFEKVEANGPLIKWHFTWIAVLPQAKGPGNLIFAKPQSDDEQLIFN